MELGAGVGFIERASGVENDRERCFGIEGHLEDLFAEKRQVEQRPAKGGAAAGVDHCFEERTAHHSGGAHAV